jgi:hypothetical protein
MGFQAWRIGSAAIVDLAEVAAQARRQADHGGAHGLRLRFLREGAGDPMLHTAAVELCIAQESRAWRGRTRWPGAPERAALQAAVHAGPVVLAQSGAGAVHGVAVWAETAAEGGELELRHVARAQDAPAGTLEYLLAGSLAALAGAGYESATLGLAVDGAGDATADDRWVGDALHRAYDSASAVPPALLDGFDPWWQERYLLYTHTTLLPRVLYAAQRAHLPWGLIPLPPVGGVASPAWRGAGCSQDAAGGPGRRSLYRAPGSD